VNHSAISRISAAYQWQGLDRRAMARLRRFEGRRDDTHGSIRGAAARRIQAAVARDLGVGTLVIVKSARDIAAIVAGNALVDTATDPSRLLVAIPRDARSRAVLASLATAKRDSDEVRVGRHAAYVWCPNGILESKVAVVLLDRLADSGTTRTWSTAMKLHALLTSPA